MASTDFIGRTDEACERAIKAFLEHEARYGVEHQRHMPPQVMKAYLKVVLLEKLVPDIITLTREILRMESPQDGTQ